MNGAALVLSGNQADYPVPADEVETYDPVAVAEMLAGHLRSPLRLAPAETTRKLVDFLQDPNGAFSMFEHVAEGGSLSDFAKRKGISYFALVSLYESPAQPFATMRNMVRKAVSREDRERARAAIRERNGYISTGRKAYADVMLNLAKAEDPDYSQAAAKPTSTQVNVQVNFAQALADHHRERTSKRVPVTIEQKPEGIDDLV